MNTVQTIKKVGWSEVEKLQKELTRMKENDYCAYGIAEISGKIQGMVYILNLLK